MVKRKHTRKITQKTTPIPRVILVVNDKDDERQSYTCILQHFFPERNKFEYLEAKDGQEALDVMLERHAEGKPVGVVLMDIDMPGMDGLAATNALRRNEEYAAIKDTHVVPATRSIQQLVDHMVKNYGCSPRFNTDTTIPAMKDWFGIKTRVR